MSVPTNPSSSSTPLTRDDIHALRASQTSASRSSRASAISAPVVDLTSDSPEPENDPYPRTSDRRERTTTFRRPGAENQTWSEFLQEPPPAERETSDSNSGGSRGTSRKRRLGSAASETQPSRVRSAVAGGYVPSRSRSDHLSSTSHGRNSFGGSTPSDSPVDTVRTPVAVARQLNSLRHRESSFTDYTLPRWQPDSEVTHCPICNSLFTFWYRKHHCRKCGRVVCASCSPHRITIPRQFIVRPPEARTSLSTIVQPNPSEAAVISLIDDEEGDAVERASDYPRPRGQQRQPSNPALGGGEEVRLCNPCVPDPNPEPPRRYNVMDSSGNETPGSTASSGHHPPFRSSSLRNSEIYGHLPSLHRNSGSLGSSSLAHAAAARELRRHRGHGMIAEIPELYRTAHVGMRNGRLPSYAAFDYNPFPSIPSSPSGYRSSHSHHHSQTSPPTYSPLTASAPDSPQHLSSRPSSSLHHRTQSHQQHPHYRVDSNRPLPLPPMRDRHRPVDESDLCPICTRILPPRGPNGREEAREAHIRSCIQSHGRGASNRSPSPPPGSGQMVHFKATEKDCIGQDGVPQECTICMEEYEVGVELTRLLCFCKFHKNCIIGWFKRKEECPVHKVLA